MPTSAPANSPIILFNKPYDVLCQFTDSASQTDGGKPANSNRQTLAAFIDQPGFYAAGRLDRDSEGLLVLCNDGKLQNRIGDPKHKMKKVYCVQVEGDIDEHSLNQLRSGMTLKHGKTRPAEVCLISEPNWLWPRHPPIRKRKHIPTCWLQMALTEGKNRQIRRMTAAVGHPTLRLIRIAVGPWQLASLKPGEWCFATSPAAYLGQALN